MDFDSKNIVTMHQLSILYTSLSIYWIFYNNAYNMILSLYEIKRTSIPLSYCTKIECLFIDLYKISFNWIKPSIEMTLMRSEHKMRLCISYGNLRKSFHFCYFLRYTHKGNNRIVLYYTKVKFSEYFLLDLYEQTIDVYFYHLRCLTITLTRLLINSTPLRTFYQLKRVT